MTGPRILFGGAAIGEAPFSTIEEVQSLLKTLNSCKITRIDSAAIYPLSAQGASEQLLGDGQASQLGFAIDTKIKAIGPGPGRGSLKPTALDESINSSLTRLKAEIDVLYCHVPDDETPIAETAAALHEHYKKNHFEKLGLSNYSVEQIEEFHHVCDDNGYVKPSYYQGQYNALCRGAEEKIFPTLRKHGMSYIAYSPLAGGFLTGNLTKGTDLEGTRLEEGNSKGIFYRKLYDKPGMHGAMTKLQAILDSRETTAADASLRWLYYHSALGGDDGLILGASKTAQIQRNAESISRGSLPNDLVKVFEEIWEEIKAEAP